MSPGAESPCAIGPGSNVPSSSTSLHRAPRRSALATAVRVEDRRARKRLKRQRTVHDRRSHPGQPATAGPRNCPTQIGRTNLSRTSARWCRIHLQGPAIGHQLPVATGSFLAARLIEVAAQATKQPHAGPQNGAPQREAHTGRQHSEQLRRDARLETVRGHHLWSLACKPSAGSPSGRRMAPLSTTSATARNRPRCTPGATRRNHLRPGRRRCRRRPAAVRQRRVRAFFERGILAHGSLACTAATAATTNLWRSAANDAGFARRAELGALAQAAAHRADHVIPHVPVRQWVRSLPIPCACCWPHSPSWWRRCCRWRVITRHLLGQPGSSLRTP